MIASDKPFLTPHKPHNGEKFALVIHGGAGTMSRETATPEMQTLYRTALKAALRAGYVVLSEGGEAMDAAVAAVTVLEGELLAKLNRIVS
jgi:isoaspartyl peptidase/L-asparaginase-like protein (Ntn-hydrolase superfamily)